jgi:putative transcriptional regulator
VKSPPTALAVLKGARRRRQILSLSKTEFARLTGIPVGTLRNWEQHRGETDQLARIYPAFTAADPEAGRKALKAAQN